MTPSPISSATPAAPAGPATVPGSSASTEFAQALARQRASQSASSQASAAPPPDRTATSTARGTAGGVTAAPPAPRGEPKGPAVNTDADTDTDASTEVQDHDRKKDSPASPGDVDALLSRLAGAEANPPGTAGTAFGLWPAPAGPSGQAAVQATASEASQALADAASSGPGLAARVGLATATDRDTARAAGLGAGTQGLDALPADTAGADLTASAADALGTAARDVRMDSGKDSAKDSGKHLSHDSTHAQAREDTAALQAAASIDKGPTGSSSLGTGVPTPMAVASAATMALPGGTSASASSPLPEARLSAPPGHADFAPQLGAQITVFVREGVQQARLQLNPAEMGPITVQIRLEGGAAQVHLAADNALTRQALEQAMPTLASSLREGGLTLTGGGVFEQPPQPGQASAQGQGTAGDGRGRSAQGHPAADDGNAGRTLDGTSLPLGSVRSRGVVDLVA